MDLQVIETGNGGDLVKIPRDLKVIYGFQTMPYLALFGGNVEESTPQVRVADRQYFDWWGNDLLFTKDPSIQFNSETERLLRNTPLTSFGRVLIEEAVKKDLSFFRDIAQISVTVSVITDDRVAIAIRIDQSAFAYIWDATKKELGEAEVQSIDAGSVTVRYFAEEFSFEFG